MQLADGTALGQLGRTGATGNKQRCATPAATTTHVVTRVGSNLYDWTSATSMALISNTASAGNWKLSGNRIVNLDSNDSGSRTAPAAG